MRRRLAAPLLPDRYYACVVETTVNAAPRYHALLMLPADRNDPMGRKSKPGQPPSTASPKKGGRDLTVHEKARPSRNK
jgi:hypothetical protein